MRRKRQRHTKKRPPALHGTYGGGGLFEETYNLAHLKKGKSLGQERESWSFLRKVIQEKQQKGASTREKCSLITDRKDRSIRTRGWGNPEASVRKKEVLKGGDVRGREGRGVTTSSHVKRNGHL